MKAVNFVLVLAVLLLPLYLTFTCADPVSPPEVKIIPLTVHEWGVMCGCTQDSSFRLKAVPPDQFQVDLPVLHLHTESTLVCDVSVSFNEGNMVMTYPQADTTLTTARWSGVTVFDTPPEMAAYAPSPPFELVPAMPILNEVECSWLVSGGELARFLFYEGIMPFENRVEVDYQEGNDSARITNNANFAIANVYAVFKEPDTTGGSFPPSGTMGYVRITELGAGESVVLPLLSRIPRALEADLLTLGFTRSEASAVEEIWHEAIFFDFYSRTTILYRIPQSVFDSLIPLHVTPEPTEIIRTLYVLVNET